MDDDMVDAEGFPRQDVDVYQVRTARNKILSKLIAAFLSKITLIICVLAL